METTSLREPSRRVSPRARSMWLVGALVESLFFFGTFLLVAYVWAPFDVRWWMPALAGGVLGVYVVVVPSWKYAVHRWEVTDTAVYTQVGWWTRERRIAPMSRIQTVAEGDPVVVLEAMKMEQPLNAHKAGTVTGLTAEVGATVTTGAVICEIKHADA